MTTPTSQSSDLIFSMTCSEAQVNTMFGPAQPPLDGETRRRAFKAERRQQELPPTQEVEEREELAEFVPLRKVSYSDLSPLSSEPILIPGEPISSTLSPGDSQKNLSRSFEDSRPRSLEMETEKDSTNSKGKLSEVD